MKSKSSICCRLTTVLSLPASQLRPDLREPFRCSREYCSETSSSSMNGQSTLFVRSHD